MRGGVRAAVVLNTVGARPWCSSSTAVYLGKASMGISACAGKSVPHEGFSRNLGTPITNSSKQWPLAEKSNKHCTLLPESGNCSTR